MDKGSILMLTDVLAPLLIKNTPYYRDRALRLRANLPFRQGQRQPSIQNLPDTSEMFVPIPVVLSYQRNNQSQQRQDSLDQQDQFFSPE
jgi:hypothetical protein